MKGLTTFLISFLVASGVAAGPFGIEMGGSASDLDLAEEGNKPSLNQAPNPHPLFKEYAVWHTEGLGICRVVAISEPYGNDRYGSGVKRDFERVSEALSQKYGSGNRVDFLKSGALWDEPQDWVMSLRQNERTFGQEWSSVESDGEAYDYIQLWVDGVSSDTTLLILEYRGKDFNDCVVEIDGQQDTVF
ncbi:hypothetical protein [Limimaricola cinnabarinus]|uniref:hypothetical protein n=1 Tax=Limimaricola cinnabarinus TaxID=1125964 RepID=UPI0013A658B4|nr:hypothetical protein [Limimaricola cinnabarinus]